MKSEVEGNNPSYRQWSGFLTSEQIFDWEEEKESMKKITWN